MLLLLLPPRSTLAQQRPLLSPLQLLQLHRHRLSLVQPRLVDLGQARLLLLALHLDPHSQLHLLSLQLLEQTPMRRLYLVRQTHLFLELLLIPHQQEVDFSLEEPVRLAPRTLAQVCSPLVPVQQLPLRLLLPSHRSPELLQVDLISLRPQHLTLGQINHFRLLVDNRSAGVGLRQRCGGGSRALRTGGGNTGLRLDSIGGLKSG